MYLADRARTGTLDPDHVASVGDAVAPEPPAGKISSTIFALGLTSFFTDIASEMVAAILPLYLIHQVGFDVGSFGLFDGALAASTVALVLLGGVLADRLRRPKPIATAGYAVSAVSRAGLALGTVPAVCLLVDRVGKGLRVAPRDALVSTNAPRHAIARAFAVHRMFDTAGALIGPLLAYLVLLLVPADYGLIFQLSVMASVLGVVTICVGVPRDRPEPLPEPAVRAPRTRLRDLSCASDVRRLVAAGALVGLVTVSDGLLFLALWRSAGLAPGIFPLLYAGSATAYLLTALPVGRLADRIGRTRLLVPSLLPLLAVYLVLLRSTTTVPMVLGCLALHGLFYALTDGLFPAATAAVTPPEARGVSLGAVQFGMAGGKLVGAAAFGAIWLRHGLEPALIVFAVALVALTAVVHRLLLPVRKEDER